MTMSKDYEYICHRMLCFHVNHARFMVSAGNFMKILFLTYDVVRSYEHDREHVAVFLNPYSRMGTASITWPTTCLWRGSDPTTWTSSPYSSASLQTWTESPHLCSIAVTSLSNSLMPHSSPQSSCYELHISFGLSYHHGYVAPSFVVLCAPLAAKIPNYKTTSGRSHKSLVVIRGLNSNARNSDPWTHSLKGHRQVL